MLACADVVIACVLFSLVGRIASAQSTEHGNEAPEALESDTPLDGPGKAWICYECLRGINPCGVPSHTNIKRRQSIESVFKLGGVFREPDGTTTEVIFRDRTQWIVSIVKGVVVSVIENRADDGTVCHASSENTDGAFDRVWIVAPHPNGSPEVRDVFLSSNSPTGRPHWSVSQVIRETRVPDAVTLLHREWAVSYDKIGRPTLTLVERSIRSAGQL